MRYLAALFLPFFLGILTNQAQAQNIPDANFANAIRNQCPACIDANNDLLPPAQSLVSLHVYNSNISSLQGVQGFTGLDTLECSGNLLTTLPTLPNSLLFFNCSSNQLTSLPILPTALTLLTCGMNQITSLPALPASLVVLGCSGNQLTSLPALPASLIHLHCGTNQITSLPVLPSNLSILYCSNNLLTSLPTLPTYLDHFECDNNQLTSLPTLPGSVRYFQCTHNQLTSLPVLPNTLERFSCNHNQLTSLPALPATLEALFCNDNQISSLPALPSILRDFDCFNNQIDTLPTLPDSLILFACHDNLLRYLPTLTSSTRLHRLECGNNQLTSLPALPASLVSLYCNNNLLTALPLLPFQMSELFCNNNQLVSLPALPSTLNTLACQNNVNLSCLPLLPNNLFIFDASGTAVDCLPNTVTGAPATLSYPICAPNNPNNCDVYAQLQGNVYIDYNNTCAFDTLNDSTAAAGILVKATDAQNNVFMTYTLAGGAYALPLTVGQYTVQAYPNNLYNACAGANITVSNLAAAIVQDLGIRPTVLCPLLYTDIDANLLRRCFTGTYNVNYANQGTTAAQNAYIDIEFDSYLAYVSNTANIAATNLGNNKYRFPVGNLLVSQSGNFQVVVDVSCNATLGQTHCTEAHIFPNTACGVNWNGAIISILDTCMVDSVVFRLVNSGTNMLASQTYQIIEDNFIYRPNTAFQLNAGGTLDIAVPTQPNRTYRIEVQQAPNYPALLGDSLAWAIVQNCNGISNTTASNPNIFNTQNAALAISNDCTPNRGAYDPNQKSAQQIGYGSQHFINANTPLEYKIEFQNTGTDTAFRVVILDTLDTNVLDPASIQIGTSSHNFTWALFQNNILKFTFDNIQLVDSFANEPLSHGYVTFNIAQQPNLTANTVINNKAAIYFDFNAPVITNTCFHTIGTDFIPRIAVSVGEVLNSNVSVKAYPNPFQTTTILEVVGADNQVLTLEIVDVMGKTVQTQKSQQSTLQISRENLPAGVYFYQLFAAGQLLNTGKLIAE